MPHVTITMVPGQSQRAKTELAQKVQECIAGQLNVEKKFVSVALEEIAKEDWDGMIKSVPVEIMYVKPGYY